MNKKELKNSLEKAKELFPDLTGAQLDVLGDEIEKYPMLRMVALLKTHWATHGSFFKPDKFNEALRADVARSHQRRDEEANMRIVDAIRRDAMKSGSSEFHGKNDFDVLSLHFATAWGSLAASEDADNFGKQTVRKLILQNAATAFAQLRIATDRALELARECVGLDEGEKIVVDRPKAGTLLSRETVAV